MCGSNCLEVRQLWKHYEFVQAQEQEQHEEQQCENGIDAVIKGNQSMSYEEKKTLRTGMMKVVDKKQNVYDSIRQNGCR